MGCIGRGNYQVLHGTHLFHTSILQLSLSQQLPPTYMFSILFNLLSLFVNNFQAFLVRFTSPFLPDSPGSACPVWDLTLTSFLQFQKDSGVLGAGQTIFLCLSRDLKATFVCVSSSCSQLFILRAVISGKGIWTTSRRMHGTARRCNTASVMCKRLYGVWLRFVVFFCCRLPSLT